MIPVPRIRIKVLSCFVYLTTTIYTKNPDNTGRIKNFMPISPSSAVQELKVSYIKELHFKSGYFLHYIFNNLGSVGQLYLQSLLMI